MAIKLTVSKSIDVDLNAYFPQFPKRLQESITEAVMALAGGDKRERKESGSYGRSWQGTHVGRLTQDDRICRIGDRAPEKGVVTKVIYAALNRIYGKKEQFFIKDLKALIETLKKDGNLPKDTPVTSAITNLWRYWGLEVIEK